MATLATVHSRKIKHRHISDCVSAQSDLRLCCSHAKQSDFCGEGQISPITRRPVYRVFNGVGLNVGLCKSPSIQIELWLDLTVQLWFLIT